MRVSTPGQSAQTFVDSHSGSAPASLIARVQEVLAADAAGGNLPVAEAMLRAAEALLQSVLRDSEAGRAVALDLLAADTCVTWAFEAAAAEPGSLPERAEQAMARIAEFAK